MIITLVALILFIGFGAVALFPEKQLSAESKDDSFAHGESVKNADGRL
jgi:hypothetical protein